MKQFLIQFGICIWLIACSSTVSAKTYYLAVGWSKPPYVIADTNSGFEIELIKQIFAELGHDIQPLYVPFGRTTSLLKHGEVDIGLTLNERHDIDSGWLSDPYIGYQNVAISISDKNLEINSIDDLLGYSVVGFQSASIVLGEKYAEVVKDKKDYLELPDQSKQVQILLRRNVDVAIMDVNIFSYFKSTLAVKYQIIDTTIHQVFSANAYRAGISDDKLRAQFNQVLNKMIKDGRYKTILDKFGLVDVLGLVTNPNTED